MIADPILQSLHKVKQTGEGRWIACCPVHDDKNPSMTITEKDESVLIYCHSCGANGKDVCEALGLDPFILFGKEFKPGNYKKPKIPASDILKVLMGEALFLRVVTNDLLNQKPINNQTSERLSLTNRRLIASMTAGGLL